MTIKTSKLETRKMTVTFPRALLQRLGEHIAPRRRSAFIVEAVEEKLALQEQLAAIEEAAGAWSDENHPDLKSDDDIDRWLAEFRQPWNEKLNEIGQNDGEIG